MLTELTVSDRTLKDTVAEVRHKRLIGVDGLTLRFIEGERQRDFQRWYNDYYNGRVTRRASHSTVGDRRLGGGVRE